MPRERGVEREHFGGEDGLVTEIVNGITKYYYRCSYCDYRIGGKSFQNEKARIHLSGDPTLRNGRIANVCTKAPKEVNEKFQLIVKQRRMDRKEMIDRKRRRAELLSPKQIRVPKQSKLRISPVKLQDKYVDECWAKAFFVLDIPINKIGEPLFRQAVEATTKSKTGYVCVGFNT